MADERKPSDVPLRLPDNDGPWADLRRLTAARIGLKRAGASLATGPLLDFQLAHARARDAVHAPFDKARLIAELGGLGGPGLAGARAARERRRHPPRPRPRRRPPPGADAVLAPHAGRHCAPVRSHGRLS